MQNKFYSFISRDWAKRELRKLSVLRALCIFYVSKYLNNKRLLLEYYIWYISYRVSRIYRLKSSNLWNPAVFRFSSLVLHNYAILLSNSSPIAPNHFISPSFKLNIHLMAMPPSEQPVNILIDKKFSNVAQK